MGRKNKRRKSEYEKRLGFNPKKYISKSYGGRWDGEADSESSTSGPSQFHGKPYRYSSRQYRKHTVGIPKDRAARQRTSGGGHRQPRRGDIWFVYLGDHPGTHVQEGCRPAVIVSEDVMNERSETLTVVPVTSKMKRLYYPTHVLVGGGESGIRPSMALIEQITTISATALGNYAGRATDEEMKLIAAGIASRFALGSTPTT